MSDSIVILLISFGMGAVVALTIACVWLVGWIDRKEEQRGRLRGEDR